MTGQEYADMIRRKKARARQVRKRERDIMLERWKCAKCGQVFTRKEYRDAHEARKHENYHC